MYKKVSGSAVVFLVLYVDDILIIGNDVSKKQFVNIYWLSKNILHERPWRSDLNIGIQICRDRWGWLLGLSQST